VFVFIWIVNRSQKKSKARAEGRRGAIRTRQVYFVIFLRPTAGSAVENCEDVVRHLSKINLKLSVTLLNLRCSPTIVYERTYVLHVKLSDKLSIGTTYECLIPSCRRQSITNVRIGGKYLVARHHCEIIGLRVGGPKDNFRLEGRLSHNSDEQLIH